MPHLAWDSFSAECLFNFFPVTDTIHHTDEIIVHLTIDGEEITTTPEHPFYVEGKGWVDAKDLQVGDEVRNADESMGEVEQITTEQTTAEMYNLTVADAHTFYVGDGQWLVHNACPVKLGYTENLKNYKKTIPGVDYLDKFKGLIPDKINKSPITRVELLDAIEKSSNINFIVDTMEIHRYPDWFRVPRVTHWEMDEIIKRGYIDKLHLWEGGTEITGKEFYY